MNSRADLISGLNTRFDIAMKSASEREFYQNCYYYFDFIHKIPELKAIFEASEKEYSYKHWELWRKRPMTDEEADEAEARTHKLERFNLFAIGATIYVRIYLPIDDYKNTDEPDEDQDPVAVILMRGPEYAKSIEKKGLKNHFKWSSRSIDLYNRWFENKRPYYEAELSRFHIVLLDEIARRSEHPRKKEISFDKEKSVLTIDGHSVEIKLKNDKPIDHYILEYIFDNPEGLASKSYYSDIIATKFLDEDVTERSMRRACESANGKISKQAGIGSFLQFETGKSGAVWINPDYL